jgi:dnd system-associated protein 4
MSKSEFEVTEIGRDIHIESSKRDLYEELQENSNSPFQDTELTKIFLFAMAYGTKKAGRTPISGDTHALFNRSSLSEDDQWIIKSIAVKEERTTEVLKDEKQVFKIAQEYANGGIDELHGKVFGPGDALVELSDEVIDLANPERD